MKRVENPPNPFESHFVEYFEGNTPPTQVDVFEDTTRSILSRNDSPDLGFRWSLNPYRGCFHGCAYCYARPSHEYLGFGAGTDFETKIVVKKKAPELLRETFLKPPWKGELIVFSGDTDCYQPLEACYGLTRRCLEVCLEFGNPLGIITKSFLITRDVGLLKKLHERTHLNISISIPFFDEKIARLIEPNTASVSKRFEAVQILAEAGLDAGVLVAPIIPGLNDSDIPKILKKAKECGAKHAAPSLLRLSGSVKEVFLSRIRKHLPLRAEKIVNRIREVREGKLTNSNFGERHHGKGPYWENIEKLFDVWSKNLGMNQKESRAKRAPFRRPTPQRELEFELS
ncbi:MAG: PA0069 family radical SAM protein [Candidatus Omnitrophica bacterium]|nr:PA0069 family radical SAM protein [Candidatus Omnitrophota bacterium]